MLKNNRYVTRGVNEEVDIGLQMIIWSMIDKLKGKENVEVDYLLCSCGLYAKFMYN